MVNVSQRIPVEIALKESHAIYVLSWREEKEEGLQTDQDIELCKSSKCCHLYWHWYLYTEKNCEFDK